MNRLKKFAAVKDKAVVSKTEAGIAALPLLNREDRLKHLHRCFLNQEQKRSE